MPVFRQDIKYGRSATVKRPVVPLYDVAAMMDQQKAYDKKRTNYENAVSEANRYAAESEKANNNWLLKYVQPIVDSAKETGAAFTDVALRTSPIEPVRNMMAGVKSKLSGGGFQEGINSDRARQLLFEKLTGKSVTNDAGKVDWEQGRKFVGRAAEAPTYLYTGAKGFLGNPSGNILSRLLSRSTAVLPEAGINTGLQALEEGDTKNIPGNFARNVASMAVLSNTLGEGSRLVNRGKTAVSNRVSNRNMVLPNQTAPELDVPTTTGKRMQAQAKVSLPDSGSAQKTYGTSEPNSVFDNTLKKPGQLELPLAQSRMGNEVNSPYSLNTNIPIENVNSDPVNKIISALRGAKGLQGAQNALYKAERSRRIGAIVGIGKNMSGEGAYRAQLGQLKGDLPKVQFESIRGGLQQTDIDELFNRVEGNKILTPFEKISAKGGLAKILGAEGGQLPTKGEVKLLSEVFPEEFINEVLSKRPLMQKLFDKAGEYLNVPRSIMSSFDLSAPLRQGIFLIGKPKQWIPAFGSMFKYAFSEKAYQNLVENIQARPTYHLMRESKLSLTDMSKFLDNREEKFMSNIAEQIPGLGKIIRGSDRAYTGFINKLRADVFDDLVNKIGPDLSGDIARFVNSATGRGELPQVLKNSQAVLNGLFFSPRLMASRINLLNPHYYVSLPAPVRKEALKSLLSFGATVSTVLGLSKLSGAEVGADPRSADFGKIKVGDTRYDVLGGFQQYAVLAYRLATNEAVSSTTGREYSLDEGYNAPGRMGIIQRFLSSKESPITSFITGMLTGSDALGQEFKVGPEVINRFVPMLTQDLSDTMGKYGATKGALMQIPSVFGVGTQTYTDQIPVLEKTPTGSPTIKWNAYPSIGEKVINAVDGTQTSNIPQSEWEGLRNERLNESQSRLELDKVKQRVLQTGKPELKGDTFVYLQNGILKTKKMGNVKSTPLKDRLLYEEINKRAKGTPFYK